VVQEHAGGSAWWFGHSKRSRARDPDWDQIDGVCLKKFVVTALTLYEAEMLVLGLENQTVTAGGDC
jgi:hypothetical protein